MRIGFWRCRQATGSCTLVETDGIRFWSTAVCFRAAPKRSKIAGLEFHGLTCHSIDFGAADPCAY